jgi:hypothetical protein
MMNHKSAPFLGMGLAAGAALLLAAGVFAVYGTGEKAIRTALDVTARWSFLLFWLSYSGGALGSLFRPAFHGLARRGREFGLAFASAHLVHIGLIVWLGVILNRLPLHGGLLVFFLVAIFFTYLLAALSFGLKDAIGPQLWRILVFVGLNYILIAFARDFVLGTVKAGTTNPQWWHLLDYGVFAGLCIAAASLRFAAAMRRHWEMRLPPPD